MRVSDRARPRSRAPISRALGSSPGLLELQRSLRDSHEGELADQHAVCAGGAQDQRACARRVHVRNAGLSRRRAGGGIVFSLGGDTWRLSPRNSKLRIGGSWLWTASARPRSEKNCISFVWSALLRSRNGLTQLEP